MILLFINFFFSITTLFAGEGSTPLVKTETPKAVLLPEVERMYDGLNVCMNHAAFAQAWQVYHERGFTSGLMAIADFTLPSDQQRFYVIDVNSGTVLLQTWVAHGKNSGENEATQFSNKEGSFMSSPGSYRIGEEIISPKHGAALMLDGLDNGINDNARNREIIIHGADYVSADFIKTHGRCGRSHGCPALPREEMEAVIKLLKPGSLLYIHTTSS
ncbi:MAG: murein L,D-transpeptidase catalytic domain family protein [Bacteroidia bacterium]